MGVDTRLVHGGDLTRSTFSSPVNTLCRATGPFHVTSLTGATRTHARVKSAMECGTLTGLRKMCVRRGVLSSHPSTNIQQEKVSKFLQHWKISPLTRKMFKGLHRNRTDTSSFNSFRFVLFFLPFSYPLFAPISNVIFFFIFSIFP